MTARSTREQSPCASDARPHFHDARNADDVIAVKPRKSAARFELTKIPNVEVRHHMRLFGAQISLFGELGDMLGAERPNA